MLNPVTIGLAGVTMVVLAIAMSAVLGWAKRAFHVEVDPKVERINDALPGANCGGCGYVGCNEYAEAVAKGECGVSLCTVGGSSCAADIAGIMGVEVEESWPLRAVVHCAADRSMRKGLSEYRGARSCAAANVVGGAQGCTYGCLGLGDCVEACEYDAISSRNGLAVIDYDACVGCSACTKVCPRNIISMVPFKSERMLIVGCSNKDMGNEVRQVCDIGCIGCKMCAKKSELIGMEGNLAIVDYERYDPAEADFSAAVEKCPMESLLYAGKPLPGEASGEEERVEAEFRTTVDRTEWWG